MPQKLVVCMQNKIGECINGFLEDGWEVIPETFKMNGMSTDMKKNDGSVVKTPIMWIGVVLKKE